MRTTTLDYDRPAPPAQEASRRDLRRARRRRPGLRLLALLVAVLVALVTAVAGGAALWVAHVARAWDSRVEVLEQPFRPEAERPAESEPGAVDVLLIGSDSRGPGGELDVEAAGATGARSDTLVLVHVSPDRRDVEVTSLMRDLWVPIPGHGEAKLNAALSWGGVPLTVATVEDLLGVRIYHVAAIDFEGFRAVTDVLGGVDVDVETPFELDGHVYPAGTAHLRGDDALTFVRARYPFADGDYTRVRNQQAFLVGVARQLVSHETLRDPARLTAFVEAVAPWVSVDSGLDLPTLVELGWSLRSVPLDHVVTGTVPTAGTATIGDQSVVLPDRAGLDAWRQHLVADGAEGAGAADAAAPTGP